MPLTGPRFVFSRDISTSRYRCVCKSAGIISQMREADYKHPMDKKCGAAPRQWPLRVSLLTMARSSPRYFLPHTSHTTTPYVYVLIAFCHNTPHIWKSRLHEIRNNRKLKFKFHLWALLLNTCILESRKVIASFSRKIVQYSLSQNRKIQLSAITTGLTRLISPIL